MSTRRRRVLAMAGGLSGSGAFEVSLASLGIPDTGTGTYLMRMALTWNPASPLSRSVFTVSDGTTSNRFMALHVQASGVRPTRVTAGALVNGTISGAVPDVGVPFGMAVMVQDDREARLLIDAAVAVSVSGGPTVPLTTLSLLSTPGGGLPVGGTWRLRYLPAVLSDAEATAAIAAFA
jgi:hypothetical protein